MTYVYDRSLSALICHVKCAEGGIFQKDKLRCSAGSHRDVKDITRVRTRQTLEGYSLHMNRQDKHLSACFLTSVRCVNAKLSFPWNKFTRKKNKNSWAELTNRIDKSLHTMLKTANEINIHTDKKSNRVEPAASDGDCHHKCDCSGSINQTSKQN